MKDRLWTRTYALGLAVGFLLSTVFYLLMTSMALYAATEFGAGELLAGMASSIFVIGAVLARLGAGIAVDRLGKRRVLLVSLLVSLLAALAYLPVNGLGMLLVVRLFHGIAFGTAHTASSAIVQSLIPASRRAEGTGYYGASTTLATALGPFLAVLVLNTGQYVWLFVAALAFSAVALVASVFLRLPPRSSQPHVAPSRSPIEPTAIPMGSFVALCAVAYSGVVAFLNSYATEVGLSAAAAVFFLVYAVVVLVTRPTMGRLQDVRGDNLVIHPSILLCVGGYFAMAVAENGATLLLAAALLGAGWGTIMSAGQAIVVSRANISQVGRSVATYFLLVDIGMGTGPIILGWLLGHVDYRTMYALLAALALLSGGFYHLVHGRHARRRIAQEG